MLLRSADRKGLARLPELSSLVIFDIWGQGGKEEGSCTEKPLSCLALGIGWRMLMLIGFGPSPS